MANMSFTNNAASTLASGITNSATSLTVATGTGALFPAISGSQYFYCTLANSSGVEIVKVTARSGDTFTIVRAQDNTTALAWNTADKVELRLVAASLNDFPKLDELNTFTNAMNLASSVTIASGSTVAIGAAASNNITISGTTTITAFDTIAAGVTRIVTFSGALTLTYNATSLILPNASNIITAAGDIAEFISLGSGNWKCMYYSKATPRAGQTTITLSSTTTSATLTAASNQFYFIKNNGTTPTAPTITMPDMTTMGSGANMFKFRNSMGQPIALNDAGGTTRQLITAGLCDAVDVWDSSSANGVWATSSQPILHAYASSGYDVSISGYKVGTGAVMGGNIVRLSSTEFAFVWLEQTTNTSGTTQTVYAKYYSVNATTLAVTAGNTVTITSVNMGDANASTTWGGTQPIQYDCDFAGRAVVSIGIVSSTGGARSGYSVVFGLVASGGTLYASSSVNTSWNNATSCGAWGAAWAYPLWTCYLGSNNAFAVGFQTYENMNGAERIYYNAYTLTGTTSPVLTAGTGNSFIGISSGYQPMSARFTLTSFGSYLSPYYIFNYTPSTNTVAAVSNPSPTSGFGTLASNIGNNYGSFAQGGFLYNSSNTVGIKDTFWDITNAGTTSMSAAISTAGIKTKQYLVSDYTTNVSGSGLLSPTRRMAVFNAGGTVTTVGTQVFTTNQANTTMDTNYSAVTTAVPDVLLSNNLGVSFSFASGGATFYLRFVRIASPFTL